MQKTSVWRRGGRGRALAAAALLTAALVVTGCDNEATVTVKDPQTPAGDAAQAVSEADDAAGLKSALSGVPGVVMPEGFAEAVGDNTLTITLTGGTFVASPTIDQFSISTADSGGFADLTGGTVTRTSNYAFRGCTGLTSMRFEGSDTVITSGNTSAFVSGSSLLSAGGASSSPYKMAAGTYTLSGTTWTKAE